MIVIVDSGSTKTEWCLAEGGTSVRRILTAGINPYFQSPEEIGREIAQKLLPEMKGISPEAVYFYGAGCTSAEKKQIISDAIRRHFPVTVEVYSDLMGAARALCGHRPGIACILGTGSNSCLYDGTDIVRNISPLGFILGDEGSGAVLGKLLVGDCLKNQLPAHLKERFVEQYRITPMSVLEHVYKQPFPNRYLAGLSCFLFENISEPYVHNLVYGSFRNFFLRNVMQYDHYASHPISFTGSVAFHYRPILEEAASSLGLSVRQVTQSPLPGLLAYHS